MRARRVNLPLVFPIALLAGLLVTYPHRLDRRRSLGQYFHGVYQSRIVGRELVLGVANAAGKITALFGVGTGLMIGWMTVTGLAFLATVWLLYRSTARKSTALTRLYFVATTVLAISAIAVTPYDLLSYALIICVFTATIDGRTWLAMGVMAVAMATRESGILVVPMLAAALMPAPSHDRMSLSDCVAALSACVRTRAVRAIAVVGVVLYVALKLAAHFSAHKLSLVQHIAPDGRLTGRGIVGILLALAMAIAIRWSYAGLDCRKEIRTRCNVMWLFASPYLLVCAFWGIWAEAPRLVMPLLLGECLVAAHVSAQHRRSLEDIGPVAETGTSLAPDERPAGPPSPRSGPGLAGAP